MGRAVGFVAEPAVASRFARVRLSSDGSRVLVSSCESASSPSSETQVVCKTSILTWTGESLVFSEGWVPLAWAGENQIYLGDDLNLPRRVALGSASSGEIEVIFP